MHMGALQGRFGALRRVKGADGLQRYSSRSYSLGTPPDRTLPQHVALLFQLDIGPVEFRNLQANWYELPLNRLRSLETHGGGVATKLPRQRLFGMESLKNGRPSF